MKKDVDRFKLRLSHPIPWSAIDRNCDRGDATPAFSDSGGMPAISQRRSGWWLSDQTILCVLKGRRNSSLPSGESGQTWPCNDTRPRPYLRPPLLPLLAKRGRGTPIAPARNLNSFWSRFLPPPHAAGTGQLRLGGMHATEKPLRPTSRLRPHPRRPRPRKTPANSQPG